MSESQRWAEALVEIDVALGVNPSNASWHAQRGFILEELDRPEDASRAYERSLELEPEDRGVAVALGNVLIQLGRHARAVEVFEELARSYPDFEPAYCSLIGAYTELGLHDKAEEMFYLAQELDERCPHCFFQIAASLFARGLTERAIYCWERVLDLEPAYVGVCRRIGRAYRSQGKLEIAREYFVREVREDPGNTDLLYELADLTLEAGDVASAAGKLAQIIELDADHAGARFALGKIWLAKGQPAQAWECFNAIDHSIDDDPELDKLDLKAGEALYQLRRFDEARERLVQAAARDTANPDIRMQIGNCLLATNKPSDAADWYRRVLALDARQPYAQHNLAVCLFQMEDYEGGVVHCLHALRSKPDYVLAMHNAAIAYVQLARWSEARSMLKKALRHDPGSQTLEQLSRRLWRFRVQVSVRRMVNRVRRILGRPVA